MRILFFDLDTLRPDHLGCYGYGRNTSPAIDAIAREGTMFTNYYCSDAPCLPSRAALLTGRFGVQTGAVGHGGTAADIALQGEERHFKDTNIYDGGLWNLFRKAGFYTASVSSFPERHSSWWFMSHLNEQYNPTGKGGMESAEEVMPPVMDWLQRNKSRDNWMLHINLWDAHTPYRTPEAFGNPFKDDPLPEWLTDEEIEKQLKYCGPHGLQDMFMFSGGDSPYPMYPGTVTDKAGVKTLIDGYDCGIKHIDDKIADIVNFLKQNGIYDDTAIIISADHGENMGELGIWGEHATADNITCRIPMIIKWKGMKKNQVCPDFHYNLDLCPTIADIFNLPAYKKWDGKSFSDTLKSGKSCGHDYLVLSQCAHTLTRAVRFDNYIYIKVYHDGFHPFPDEMLFDLEKDCYEQNNLAGENPALCATGARLLSEWHTENMFKSESKIDPMITVLNEGGPFHTKNQLEYFIKRLESTGRGHYVDELRKKHSKT